MPVAQIAMACDHLMVFKGLHREDKLALYSHMYEVTYRPGEKIVRMGEMGRNFYLVTSGTPLRLLPGPSPNRNAHGFRKPETGDQTPTRDPPPSLKPGDSFGEVALLHSLPAAATIIAMDTEVTCLVLDCVTFRKLLSTAAVERRTKLVQLLSHVPLFESLHEVDLVQLADALETRNYPQGRVIILQDNAATARFHIIESGHVSVRLEQSTREVKQLQPGGYFGEVTLMNENTAPPTATVVALTETHTLSLGGEEFRRLLGDMGVQNILSESLKRYEYEERDSDGRIIHESDRNPMERVSAQVRKSVATTTSAAASGISGMIHKGMKKLSKVFSGTKLDKLGRAPVGLDVKGLCRENVHFLKELGHGMTSVVYLCRLPTINDRLVVIKMMKKTKLIRLNQVKNIVREKELVTRFNCPYVVSALGSFQDDHYLYLLMEHLEGGELFRLLVKMNTVPVATARLYTAEILIALQYIHASGHVYRDLKPENVLLTSDGHLVLTDMGFCKPLRSGEKTFTTCGTADYMAPEVMLCKGHNMMADYWSLGVFIYEMLAGYAPFESRNESERYYKILNAKLKFPPDFDPQAAALIKQLCVVEPSKRLGCSLEGVNEIRRQPFFETIDWVELDNPPARRTPGPHVAPNNPTRNAAKAEALQKLKPMIFREPAFVTSDVRREVNNAFAKW